MLDDSNVLRQRDPHGALVIAATQWQQVGYEVTVGAPEHDDRPIDQIVVTGMGGSALAADLIRVWLGDRLDVPFEIVRGYALPHYVGSRTLVIADSYSGNTEETLSCLHDARDQGAQVAVVASGGKLLEIAQYNGIAHVALPTGVQPRMAVFYNLRALVALLVNFGIVAPATLDELAGTAEFLRTATDAWLPDVTTDKNEAKQLALLAVGKTPVFYGGAVTAPLAYKWKISWNENAKNVAFWNQYPEFNHNEFMGWASHPVDKPFAVFDLRSQLEHQQIQKRFELSDRLLSGLRPKAHPIQVQGSTVLEQLLWGSILADFASIYVAVLNGVDPVPVPLIEKFKQQLNA